MHGLSVECRLRDCLKDINKKRKKKGQKPFTWKQFVKRIEKIAFEKNRS